MHFLEWVQIDPPSKIVLYKERGKNATHFGPLYGGTTVYALLTNTKDEEIFMHLN